MDGKASSLRLRMWWTSLAGAAALALSGCAGWDPLSLGARAPVPDEPGMYAQVDAPDGGSTLQRLDGPRQWEIETWRERSHLDPDVSFVIRHPDVAMAGAALDQTIHLRRVAWVRSTVSPRGEILPVEGGPWAVPDFDAFAVPLRIERLGGRNDAVRVVPVAPLEPGLYSLELGQGPEPVRARIGVQWTAVDQRSYSAATCVDRYEGPGPRYRPCADQTQQPLVSAAPEWLRLYLVDPELRGGTRGQNLVIKGIVVNTSDAQHATVPTLEAQVRAANGAVLQSWRFDPGVRTLGPGESASFSTEGKGAPPGAHDVFVRFSPS